MSWEEKYFFPTIRETRCKAVVISELRLGRSLLLTDVSVERRGSLEKAHFRRRFFDRCMFNSYVRYALSRNHVTFFSTHPADIYLQTRHRMTNNILIYHRGTSFFRPAKKPRYYRTISSVMSNGRFRVVKYMINRWVQRASTKNSDKQYILWKSKYTKRL